MTYRLDTENKRGLRSLCIKFKNVFDNFRMLKGASLFKDIKENWLNTQLHRKKQKEAQKYKKQR